MVVVCLGPVCIPLYGLLPVLVLVLKPIWNALPLSIQQFLQKMWRTIEQTPVLLVLLMSICVAVSVLACYWTMENKILFAIATVGTFVSAGNFLYGKLSKVHVVATPESIQEMEKVLQSNVNTIAIATEIQWQALLSVAKDRSLRLVVDFSSESCGPCKAIAPVFQQLAEEFSERAIFATVDVDQAPAIRNLRSVVALPTFQAIEAKTGTDLFSMEGANEGKLRALVHQVLGGDKMKWQECNSCGDGDTQKK